MLRASLFAKIALLLLPSFVSLDTPLQFIVWKVGQGQATTLILPSECWHFDMGGEKSPLNMIRKLCGAARNRIFLSHFDQDHVNFIPELLKRIPNVCLMNFPGGPWTLWKQKINLLTKPCADREPSFEIFKWGNIQVQRIYQNLSEKIASNEASEVFLIQPYGILIPGDSSIQSERMWVHRLPKTRSFILVLGHHGSKSSTSQALLNRYPARQNIASARFRKYGHPHFSVRQCLQKARLPFFTTESWGNLHFRLN